MTVGPTTLLPLGRMFYVTGDGIAIELTEAVAVDHLTLAPTPVHPRTKEAHTMSRMSNLDVLSQEYGVSINDINSNFDPDEHFHRLRGMVLGRAVWLHLRVAMAARLSGPSGRSESVVVEHIKELVEVANDLGASLDGEAALAHFKANGGSFLAASEIADVALTAGVANSTLDRMARFTGNRRLAKERARAIMGEALSVF